jgi:uncharacterized membrane protein YfcA
MQQPRGRLQKFPEGKRQFQSRFLFWDHIYRYRVIGEKISDARYTGAFVFYRNIYGHKIIGHHVTVRSSDDIGFAEHDTKTDFCKWSYKRSTHPFNKRIDTWCWRGHINGTIGAGGGFLIIPVLVFSFRLSMKDAIGTSLLIIAMNSLFGFAGDLFHQQFDWKLLLPLTAIAVTGTFIGRRLGQDLDG